MAYLESQGPLLTMCDFGSFMNYFGVYWSIAYLAFQIEWLVLLSLLSFVLASENCSMPGI